MEIARKNRQKPAIKFFWVRFEQAKLLLNRLNDKIFNDINPTPDFNYSPVSCLDACCWLYSIYATITADLISMKTAGYEIPDNIYINIYSFEQHFKVYLLQVMTGHELEKFNMFCDEYVFQIIKKPDTLYPILRTKL